MEKSRLIASALIFCCLFNSAKIKNNIYPINTMGEIKEFVESLESRRVQEESQLEKQRIKAKRLYRKALEMSHICQRNFDSNNKLLEYLESPTAEFPAAVTDFERLLEVYQPYKRHAKKNEEIDDAEERRVIILLCRYLCPSYKLMLDEYIPVLDQERGGIKHKKGKEGQQS